MTKAHAMKLIITILGELLGCGFALTQSIPVVADTFVDYSAPANTFGANTTLAVRNVGGGVRSVFLRFDLSSLPAQVTVTKATLRLWVRTVTRAER